MLKTAEHRLLCGLAILSLLLVGVNIGFYFKNRAQQESVNARAQYIQQSLPIRDLYQGMAKALAELAVKNHDVQLQSILGEEGFKIDLTPTTGGSSAASPPAQKGKP